MAKDCKCVKTEPFSCVVCLFLFGERSDLSVSMNACCVATPEHRATFLLQLFISHNRQKK